MADYYVSQGYVADAYFQTGITIDWGAKVIFVPKFVSALVQSSPSEVRQLDLDVFRLALKDLEDSDNGIVFPTTHNHNTTVTVGGVTLARVIEIINGYTVTFEDGQYAINLTGANSNVGDVVNLNQVSVRVVNSAGLVAGGDGIPTASQNAAAVWADASAIEVINRLAETWARLGLDASKPVTNGTTQITFGDLVLALTQSGNDVTVTRQ